MLRKIAILLVVPAVLLGQTVLDGVYTEAQALRGEAQYHMHCAGCHGETLDGRAMGALRGEKFLDRWREDNLDFLYTHIRTRMPDRAPGSLSESVYLDILAFILQANNLPAGASELTTSAVTVTKLVGKDGPRPLATNALVQLVGCFTPGSNNSWRLTGATEPARTRNPEESTAQERKAAEAHPLGSQTFRLQNLDELRAGFRPESYQGHKVQVKGVLIRGPNNDRINVLSLETVAAACGPQ